MRIRGLFPRLFFDREWTRGLDCKGGEGEGPATDVMEINRLGDLADIANLGLTLGEAKPLLAALQ